MSSGLRGRRCQPVSRGGEITGNAEVARLRNLIAENRNRAVFVPRRANEKITQHSLSVIASLRLLDNCGFSFGKKTGEQDCALYLGAGDRHLIANSAQRAPVNAQRWSFLRALRGNVCSHSLQWSDDAIHRPLGKGRIPHQAALECLPSKKARHQPHGGSGIAAINFRGWRIEHALFSVDDNGIGLRLIDTNPQPTQNWKEESSDIRRACPATRLFHPKRSEKPTAPERFCWCRDLSLRFLAGNREHPHSPDWARRGWSQIQLFPGPEYRKADRPWLSSLPVTRRLPAEGFALLSRAAPQAGWGYKAA